MLPAGISIGILFLVIGVPIFVVFAVSGAIILVYHLGVTWYTIGHSMFYSVTNYPLVALPLFILVGHFMLQGGLARRMTDFFIAWFGHYRGGLAIASIIAVGFFGAISGSILAGIITIGTIMIPEMVKQGYSKSFAAAVIAVAAGLDTLIPPSGTAIIYSSITGAPLAKIFMAGLIPGIIQMLLLLVVVVVLCRKMPAAKPVPWRQRFVTTYKALPVLVLPVVILGSIYTGLLLPSEAGAVACILCLLFGSIVYREITLRKVWQALTATARITCIIFILIATATFLSLVLVYTRIPQNLTAAIMGAGITPTTFLFMAVLTSLILGTFLEAVPNIVVTAPVFMVIALNLGVDLIHLYVPFCIFIGIGLLTPPVSVGVYTAASVSGESPERLFRHIFPWFFLALLASGVINILVPELSLWLPSTMP